MGEHRRNDMGVMNLFALHIKLLNETEPAFMQIEMR